MSVIEHLFQFEKICVFIFPKEIIIFFFGVTRGNISKHMRMFEELTLTVTFMQMLYFYVLF